MDELQSQLLEWQEIVPESEDAHNQIREEKSAMALRMAQIEEEREGELVYLQCYFFLLDWQSLEMSKLYV